MMDPISSRTRTFDVESQAPQAPAVPVPSKWKRNVLIGAGLAAVAGGATVIGIVAGKHHTATPALPHPQAPAPAPQPVHVAPAAPAAPPPAPASNNLTGFLNTLPLSIKPTTAMYVGVPFTGGEKFAVIITDANETCQTLSASPVRTTGIQEVDLCQATNGSAILAQNGRIIQNGQQFQSTAVSLNGTTDGNRVLSGHFGMNTTNAGYVTGNFTALPCDTMKFENFCDLQN